MPSEKKPLTEAGQRFSDEAAPWSEDRLITEALTLKQALDAMEERRRVCNEHLIRKMFDKGLTSFEGQYGTAGIQNKTTKTINRAKLIAHGVDPVDIDDSTDISISDPFVVIRPAKKEV